MKLRTHLIVLVIASLLPVIIFAGVMIYISYQQQRADIQRGMTGTARALALALDGELRAAFGALETLSTSEHLDTGKLKQFHENASRALKSRSGWENVALVDPSGQQVVNTRVPFGTVLPMTGALDFIRQVAETGQPTVSNLFQGPLVKRPVILVGSPMVRSGKVRFVLTLGTSPAWLTTLLSNQRLPPGWIGAILDHNTIVGRTQSIEKFLGQPAMPLIVAKSTESEEGWFKGSTKEGVLVYAAFSRARLSGWTVALGIPVSQVEAPLQHALLISALAGLLFLILGVSLGVIVSRKVNTSVIALSAGAGALGRGEMPRVGTLRIAELNEVGDEIETAAVNRERAEEDLQRWAHLFEHAEWGVVVGSADGKSFEQMNPAFARMHGFTVEELTGKSIADVFAPEARAELPEQIRTAHEKGHRTFESSHIRKDGTIFPVLVDVTAVKNPDGQIAHRVVNVQDITERKRAEVKLRENEQRLQKAQRVARMGFLDWNLKTNDIYWSDEVYRLYGVKSQDFKATLDLTMQSVHPDDLDFVQKELDSAIQGASEYDIDHRILRRDGEVLWVHAQAELTRDADGNPHRLLGTVVDITERKRAEEALRESEERFRAIASKTPDHVLMQDRDLRYQWVVNPQLGLTETNMIGKTDQDILGEKEDAEKLTAVKRKVLETGEPVQMGFGLRPSSWRDFTEN